MALLAPVLAERIERAGLRTLLDEVELPLSSVLARMQANGVALDVAYLEEMAEGVRDRMATLQAEIYRHAGEEFNLNSPPQLRLILYEKLGLSPGKRTPKGQLSTDATVLEKLRDAHPIVDALLSWRELDKLNSTYLEALPRQVDPRDGRVHTTFNQTGAATGRLSSSNPNLQNIPVRGELGRQIRRAFIPGRRTRCCSSPTTRRSSCGSSRTCRATRGCGPRSRRGGHPHGDRGPGVRPPRGPGRPRDPQPGEGRQLRPRVRDERVGLASRLEIAPDEARSSSTPTSRAFPQIREFLDRQVARAAAEGFTETMLGRRRYIPELQASNPRVRDMGRRMALNTPIQGSAADVFKLGMLRVDRGLQASDLECRMLLTVHDELVFEVPTSRVEEAGALVKREMEAAYELSVPLRADIGWGPNWAEAVPAGH